MALTTTEVLSLQAVRDDAAVSVLMTTTPARSMLPAEADRLHELVEQAAARVREALPPDTAELVVDRLRLLELDAAHGPTRRSVALYAGRADQVLHRLPVEVRDRAVVDPTFATRDLVRALHRTPRHVVLVLTERSAGLFDGVDEQLRPVLGSTFPLRSSGGAPRDTSRRSGTERDPARREFLRRVDRALGAYLRLRPAPLVVAGTERVLAEFLDLSRNTRRLAGSVRGSYATAAPSALVPLIRPVLERYLRSRQDEALALLERRRGTGRCATGLQSVWLAARRERPEMLAVEETLFAPVRLSEDGDFLTPADDVEHPDVIDDAVDEVIETVLQRGGWIALVEDGALADSGRIALTLQEAT